MQMLFYIANMGPVMTSSRTEKGLKIKLLFFNTPRFVAFIVNVQNQVNLNKGLHGILL